QFKLNRWNNGKVIIQMQAPVELSKEQNIRQFAKDLRNQMAAQISALDAELGNDYTSQQQPQSE
ncbi:MAG: 1-acyl-sn-glycerol-3-phosphate acyltransferase, partial [Alishewanella sp. 34-51-39]